MYLSNFSMISCQPSFRNEGFSQSMQTLNPSSELVAPDFKAIIPALERRRMDLLMKMSMSCAIESVQDRHQEIEGLIIGSALGMGNKTAQFMRSVYEREQKPISPTSFTVSTHNTLAGQLALKYKMRGYNTTISQSSLTLEHCLIDAKMSCAEGRNLICLGVADEDNGDLYNMNARLGMKETLGGAGSCFFLASSVKSDDSIRLKAVRAFHAVPNLRSQVNTFLEEHEIKYEDIDLVLYSSCKEEFAAKMDNLFPNSNIINYLDYSGHSITSSSFALAWAEDQIKCNKEVGQVLIVNNLFEENLGLTHLKSQDET